MLLGSVTSGMPRRDPDLAGFGDKLGRGAFGGVPVLAGGTAVGCGCGDALRCGEDGAAATDGSGVAVLEVVICRSGGDVDVVHPVRITIRASVTASLAGVGTDLQNGCDGRHVE